MSRLKFDEDRHGAVVRRLRREAPRAWRAPPARLRRRVMESLEARGERGGAPPGAPWRTLAWAAAWLILVGIASVLVVGVVPRGVEQSAQPAGLSLGTLDAPVDSIDELVATYEAPLRDEVRLIVADARTMHAALMRRLPYPTREGPDEAN